MDCFSKRGLVVSFEEGGLDQHLTLIKERNSSEGFVFEVPYYVTYKRRSAGLDLVLADLKSSKRKKIKKFLKRDDVVFGFFQGVHFDLFQKWYEGVYVPLMDAKEGGRLAASRDWPLKNSQDTFGVIAANKDGEVIGGVFGRRFDSSVDFSERVSISYSGFKKDSSLRGLSEACNALFIDFVNKMQISFITRGRDFNLYGLNLSTGLPKFKCDLGFSLDVISKQGFYKFKFCNISLFKKDIFFVSRDKGKLIGNYISSDFDSYNAFLLQGLNALDIFKKVYAPNNNGEQGSQQSIGFVKRVEL